MTRLFRFTTAAAVSLVASGIAISASAATLGIELEETGFTTYSLSGSSNPLIVSQPFGTFSVNTEVNNLGTNPLSLDISSSNTSTDTAGTLTIVASASDLTSPIGLEEFLSQFTGHLVSGSTGASVELQTYISDSNTLFGTDTLLSTLGPSSLPVNLSGLANAATTNPFAITEVLTITTTGASAFSLDGSMTDVPEPASMALLGAGLIGFGLVRRRQTRKQRS